MRLSLLWAILLVPLLGTAYADSNPDYFTSVGNSLDGLIDMIINAMNPIFKLAFNLQDNDQKDISSLLGHNRCLLLLVLMMN